MYRRGGSPRPETLETTRRKISQPGKGKSHRQGYLREVGNLGGGASRGDQPMRDRQSETVVGPLLT